ncbi:TetR family transcriptional regulator [Thermopolyspora flexuosa]|jgi:AcrR family transcriptional regulator|uniref:TetR family transcriptional regulator n=1 Tax=Thermopolyspora flexuosa TaxID=103836 RepID=A0A543ISI6_9ACTN|nr:WHG domain-containing protein [Thermopolyspora flexuosa]TQM73517.1 TetR family transcriptional regulator [Thermopolyspora flexuosa]GGM81859.1 TetR family transcriptional regulator [Thermopolyspora flexuosa]
MTARNTASRRERLREATVRQIHAAARRLLVSEGSSAVTINALARELGMSGPALYRYYASRDELVEAVTAGFYRELTTVLEETRAAWAAAPANRRILAMCRALRGWSIAHPAEFGWMFASPRGVPGEADADSPRYQAGYEFGRVFMEEIAKVWEGQGFPVPDLDELDPSLRAQVCDYAARVGGLLPPEALHVFLNAWIRLYGLLCMEVMKQLDFAYRDLEPVFEECLREICGMFALEYEPPSGGSPAKQG